MHASSVCVCTCSLTNYHPKRLIVVVVVVVTIVDEFKGYL